MQKTLGRFSSWGALLYPLSLLLFGGISFLVIYDLPRRRLMVWKSRAYPAVAKS